MGSMTLLASLISIISITHLALANVEKTIFTAPEPVPVPLQHPTLSDLRLHVLNPVNTTVRTRVRAEFPSNPSPSGVATWLLLENLHPGRRYEVRICWAATQPTAFRLDAYPLSVVWDTPQLVGSLAEYAAAREGEGTTSAPLPDAGSRAERRTSVLFLRVLAAAEYFSHDKAMMKTVPPVHVDIILDPYVFNVVPRSLLPTIGFIVFLAPISWFVGRAISSWIEGMATRRGSRESKKDR